MHFELNHVVWCMQAKFGNCGERMQKETVVSLNETVPQAKRKGTFHLIQKVWLFNQTEILILE